MANLLNEILLYAKPQVCQRVTVEINAGDVAGYKRSPGARNYFDTNIFCSDCFRRSQQAQTSADQLGAECLQGDPIAFSEKDSVIVKHL